MSRYYVQESDTFDNIFTKLNEGRLIALDFKSNAHFPFLLYFLSYGYKILDAQNGIMLFGKEKRTNAEVMKAQRKIVSVKEL